MNPRRSEHNIDNQAEHIKLVVENRSKLRAEEDDDINTLPPENFLKSPK
jgi:hypothetical protein